MSWMYLIIAGLFEIGGVIGLKRSADKETWGSSVLMFGSFGFSLFSLSKAS